MLLRRPGTSGLAVLALALGLGLTTTMFSIVDSAFLRGLPFDHPEQIVALSRQRVGTNGFGSVPPHDFVDWKSAQHTFQDLAGSTPFVANIARAGNPAERYRGARITPNMLALLRAAPALGRDFTDADARPDAAPVALISDTLWRGQFVGARDVVGKTLRVNGATVTILGVMPPRFAFPNNADIWIAERLELPDKRNDGRSLAVVGRLKPGVSLASAQADMRTIARQLAQQYPENKDITADVLPYTRRYIGVQIIATLSAMLGAVFGVLLIACVNVTNLQLARAAERMKEVAVRFALGATRWNVVRQLLVEGLLLSAAGALLGLGIAQTAITLFNRGIADTNPPFWLDIRIDVRILLFVLGLTVVATLASSLVPALRVARQDVNEILKDEGRSSTGFRVGFFSRILVVVEMTASFVLLVVSGLMIKSVVLASTLAYPFATNLLVASLTVPEASYHSAEETRQVIERMHERLAAVPGLSGVAVATGTPDGGGMFPVTIEGDAPASDTSSRPAVRRVEVSPEYFDVIRVRVREGRAIAASDRDGAPLVVVVSDSFVRRFFPKGDALGRRIRFENNMPGSVTAPVSPPPPWRTIVGVVPSLVVARQSGDVTESVFAPLAQTDARDVTFFAAATAPQALIGPALRKAAMDVDPNLALYNLNTLDGVYDQRVWPFRVFGGLFTTFGLAALLLSAAGLYGVMSFAVRRRTQEIGVRMALGANRARITWMVVRQGLWQVGIGMALGLGLGGLLGSSLRLLLFHVQPWDPVIFGVAMGVLAGTGLLASYVPALRAASIDPLRALRHD